MNFWKCFVIGLLVFVAVLHLGAVLLVGDRDFELTNSDYYGQELVFQEMQGRLREGASLIWETQVLPETQRLAFRVKSVSGESVVLDGGTVQLYRSNDARQDRALALLSADDGSYQIDTAQLRPGVWQATVEGKANGKPVAWRTRLVL